MTFTQKTLLLVLVFFTPLLAYAALININTADQALLETLPGIGPAKAAAIITYRETNGPFATIEDIQNVSGIGPATYADIAPLISVSGGNTPPPPPPPASSQSSPSPATTQNSSQERPQYIPTSTLRLSVGSDRSVVVGADTLFDASVQDSAGKKPVGLRVEWSMGDGMQRVGASILHTYYAPGDYVVHVEAFSDDGGEATSEFVVTARSANVAITAVSGEGITLSNPESYDLDLSLWRLRAGAKEFKFPAYTKLLAKRSLTFSPQVTQLAPQGFAELLYPSGSVAATYPSAVQPATPTGSYRQMQTVEPVLTRISPEAYEDKAVVAPAAATTNVAAAGAAVVPGGGSPVTALLTSPWTLGFLGLLVISGAALLLL